MNSKVKEKIQRVQSLSRFIEGWSRTNFDCNESGRDGASLDVSKPDTIILHSWLESHHNGDPYDSKSRELNDDEAEVVLDYITGTLEAQAVKIVIGMEDREAKKNREDQAKKRLETLLQSL